MLDLPEPVPVMDGQEALPLSLPPSVEEEPPTMEFRAPATGTPRYAVEPSPIGELLLVGDGQSLTGLHMLRDQLAGGAIGTDWVEDRGSFADAVKQLRSYFAGELRYFDLPLAPAGTDFQRRVWQALTTIPYGQTATYGEIAEGLGRPRASRAVGMANGRNPIAVVVPCHRVIGADGSLTGYGGGLQRKEYLLSLERRR